MLYVVARLNKVVVLILILILQWKILISAIFMTSYYDFLSSRWFLITFQSFQGWNKLILEIAETMGLTGREFVWVLSQSIVGDIDKMKPKEFPLGLFGKDVLYNISFVCPIVLFLTGCFLPSINVVSFFIQSIKVHLCFFSVNNCLYFSAVE